MSFKAEVVADSINQFEMRMSTLETTFPRIILAEMNTHKMLSKNSASSRAIPFDKNVKNVEENTFHPLRWMLDHKGMQGSDYIEDPDAITDTDISWSDAMHYMVHIAKKLNKEHKVTKQICNRLLEPFMYHTALMSGTEWENFTAQRADGPAEIHMQKIAYLILEALNESKPQSLKPGEWHLPYSNQIDYGELQLQLLDELNVRSDSPLGIQQLIKISTAYCAGTSYVVYGEDGKVEDFKKLVDRHDNRLVKPGHWSPMEHPARSMSEEEFFGFGKCIVLTHEAFEHYEANNDRSLYIPYRTNPNFMLVFEYGWCKNLRGFIPYRHFFPEENRKDPRLIKKKYEAN